MDRPEWHPMNGTCHCGKRVTEVDVNIWVGDDDDAMCPDGKAWHYPREESSDITGHSPRT